MEVGLYFVEFMKINIGLGSALRNYLFCYVIWFENENELF
jgi:hypothetical protein